MLKIKRKNKGKTGIYQHQLLKDMGWAQEIIHSIDNHNLTVYKQKIVQYVQDNNFVKH
jgi:hypothetical protein